MFALNDTQLALVMTAAGPLPAEKRSVFLERLAARLRLRGPRFTDADLGAAIQAALTGLIQSAPSGQYVSLIGLPTRFGGSPL